MQGYHSFMNTTIGLEEPDWSLWRSFEAVVNDGTLSGAARHLGLSQPTLGRHVDALEQKLGITLFERTLQGFQPTEIGLRLLEPVKVAQAALAEARNMAEGSHAELSGTVRIAASTVTSHYTLPHILRTLRQEFPTIEIELVPSDSTENLLMREADIAVRMFRPTQLDLITKKIAESPSACCAHQSYLQDRPAITTHTDLYHHDLVGLDRSDLIISAASKMGFDLKRSNFAIRTDSQTALWELMKAGLGIGFAQKILVDSTPGMVALLPDLPIPPLEVWLTTHRELFTSRKNRVIYDRLGDLLASYFATAIK